MTAISTLGDALQRLEKAVADVPIGQLPALLGAVEQIKAAGWTRILQVTEQAGEKDELLTIPEVAQRLKISTYRGYELAREGRVKSVRFGKSVRVKASDLASYIAVHGS